MRGRGGKSRPPGTTTGCRSLLPVDELTSLAVAAGRGDRPRWPGSSARLRRTCGGCAPTLSIRPPPTTSPRTPTCEPSPRCASSAATRGPHLAAGHRAPRLRRGDRRPDPRPAAGRPPRGRPGRALGQPPAEPGAQAAVDELLAALSRPAGGVRADPAARLLLRGGRGHLRLPGRHDPLPRRPGSGGPRRHDGGPRNPAGTARRAALNRGYPMGFSLLPRRRHHEDFISDVAVAGGRVAWRGRLGTETVPAAEAPDARRALQLALAALAARRRAAVPAVHVQQGVRPDARGDRRRQPGSSPGRSPGTPTSSSTTPSRSTGSSLRSSCCSGSASRSGRLPGSRSPRRSPGRSASGGSARASAGCSAGPRARSTARRARSSSTPCSPCCSGPPPARFRARTAPFIAARAVGAHAARGTMGRALAEPRLVRLHAGNRAPQALHDMIARMADGEPGWLARIENGRGRARRQPRACRLDRAGGGLRAVAVGVYLPRPAARATLVLAIVVAAAIWVFGEASGGSSPGARPTPTPARCSPCSRWPTGR